MADGARFLVFHSTWKLGAGLVFCIFFLFISIIILVDGALWPLWAIPLFGALGYFNYRQWRKRKEPVFEIDQNGIKDNRSGVALRWDEVTHVRLRTIYGRGFIQRWLVFRVTDPDAVIERSPHEWQKKIARIGKKLPFGDRIMMPLTMLNMRAKKVLEGVRRYYSGPVEG